MPDPDSNPEPAPAAASPPVADAASPAAVVPEALEPLLAAMAARRRPGVAIVRGPWPYQAAAAVQQALVAAAKDRGLPPLLLLLEHPLVVTLGRAADPADAAGAAAPVVRSHRGGSVTVHGPGQVVGYPIVDLRAVGLGVHGFVRELEGWMAAAAARFGVSAHSREGWTGLWTERGKLGSIGIAVRRGVTWHGLALYAGDQEPAFGAVNPCALPGVRPDCLAAYDPTATWETAAAAVADAFADRFGPAAERIEVAAAEVVP